MHIALDIDDTITHAPEFFSWISQLASEVTVITYREDRDKVRELLATGDFI